MSLEKPSLWCRLYSKCSTLQQLLQDATFYRERRKTKSREAKYSSHLRGWQKICIMHRHHETVSCTEYSGPQRCQCILYSVVFTPSPPSHHGSVWLLPIISLLLTTVILSRRFRAGMPVHMIGEVSWDSKRRRVWAS